MKKKTSLQNPKRIPKCPNCLRLNHLFICFPNTTKLTQYTHTHIHTHPHIHPSAPTQIKFFIEKEEPKNQV